MKRRNTCDPLFGTPISSASRLCAFVACDCVRAAMFLGCGTMESFRPRWAAVDRLKALPLPAPKHLLELGMHGHHALLAIAALRRLERLLGVLRVDAKRTEWLRVRRPVAPTPSAGFPDTRPGEELQRVEHPAIQPIRRSVSNASASFRV